MTIYPNRYHCTVSYQQGKVAQGLVPLYESSMRRYRPISLSSDVTKPSISNCTIMANVLRLSFNRLHFHLVTTFSAVIVAVVFTNRAAKNFDSGETFDPVPFATSFLDVRIYFRTAYILQRKEILCNIYNTSTTK